MDEKILEKLKNTIKETTLEKIGDIQYEWVDADTHFEGRENSNELRMLYILAYNDGVMNLCDAVLAKLDSVI